MKPLRRALYGSAADTARAVLARAPFVHLAGIDDDGAPVLRTVHGVIVGDRLCFHGAPAGEKMAVVGKPVVIQADEVVAEIPSYFIDPVRACPATTLYQSAQVHGVLERVDDVDAKAAVLQALMQRFQPEGGHRPISAHDEMYAAAVRGILVAGVSLAQLQGKSKLAQNRTPAELARLIDNMWKRGAETDAQAIELVRAANPRAHLPAFLTSPMPGVHLRVHLDDAYVDDAVDLLQPLYWNADLPRDVIARAHRGSAAHGAWVGAVDDEGALLASARAISDGGKWACVFDVVVRDDLRGRGVGSAVVKLLLDHPRVRGTRKVLLATRDAQAMYAKLGFIEKPMSKYTEMTLDRGAFDGAARD